MPFPMKIQPIDSYASEESIGSSLLKAPVRNDLPRPAVKWRLKRLFERQFPNVLRTSGGAEQQCNKDSSGIDAEPSSVCLAKMVRSFMEETNDNKQTTTTATNCGRSRCNCLNGNCNDCDDGEFDCSSSSCDASMMIAGEACEFLKSLVTCASVSERNILADTAKIVEKNKICKNKDDCRKIVIDELLSLGYDASICKSRWEKSPSFPAGEYEYIDVIVEGERLLIDIDFRSEFEIARSTGSYKAVLQSLPSIFVGKADRLQHIVAVVSEAAKQSLKKEGLHIPPWRKPEYMRAKWLAPYQRVTVKETGTETTPFPISTRNFSGEFELIFGERVSTGSKLSGEVASVQAEASDEKIKVVVSPWQPPAVKPKVHQKGAKIVTGLASVLREKP
ncbi:hypothetical protein AAC387_Pa06g1360 [Persea americana]